MNGWILRAGTKTPGAHRAPVSAVVRLRRLAAAIVVGALALLGLHVVPAQAAGVGTIAKKLDPVQGAGFTAPDTFQTGALVRYTLNISCSSNTTDCGIGKITDVLDPNLEYVGIVQPTQTTPVIPVSASASGQTVTITVGSASVPWPDGNKLNIVLVARVRPTAAGTIPNQATLTTNGGTTQSDIVNINTPPATPQWSLYKVSSSAQVAPGESTTYTILFKEPSTFGNVDITGGTLTDTLPAGAVVVDAGGGTVGTDASGNTTITWAFTGTIPFATQVNCGPTGCTTYWSKQIVVKFPNPPFTGGQTPVNNASATVTYSNGSSATLTAQASLSIVKPVIGAYPAKEGPTSVMAGETIQWRLIGQNTGNVSQSNWSLVDNLPTGFANFTLFPSYDSKYMPISGTPKSPVTFSYVDAAGATIVLGTFTSPPATMGPTYTIPGDAKQVIITADSLSPGSYIHYRLKAVAPADAAVGSTFTNCATMTGAGLGVVGNACVTTTIVAPYTQVGVYKHATFADLSQTSQVPGDVFYYTIGVRKFAGVPLTSADITDYLPAAFEYVPGSACANSQVPAGSTPDSTWWTSSWMRSCPSIGDPVQTANTPAAGQTLLQWLNLPMPSGVADGSYYYTIAFQVRVLPGTAIANYTNYANTNTTVPGTNTTCTDGNFSNSTVKDTAGVNSVAGTGDPMCQTYYAVQVRQAAVTSSYKWVKGDVGTNVFESTGTTTPGATDPAVCPDQFGGYTRYPCVAEVNPGGTFDYKFDIVNEGNIPLTNYTFYDILPHIGDVGVNQALSGSGRLTQWTPVLTGPVTPEATVPAGAAFTVLYNLSYDPCRPELSAPTPGVNWQGATCTNATGGTNAQNTWYTQAQIEAMAGTWANVKSFKIVMYAGVTAAAAAWPAGVHMYFDAPMHAPMNAPASSLPGMAGGLNLSAAWNSLGDQVSGLNPADGTLLPQLAAAPRKVGIIVPAKPQVQVGDYVWVDANKDGLQDATDVPIPGVVLVLTGPDGQPVTDVFGNVVPPQATDATGHYLFPNLPLLAAGQSYTVTIDKTASAAALAGYVPTTANAGTDTSIDSSSWTASSTGLTVDGQKDLTLDFGFVTQPVSIGDYVWLDNNRDGLQTAGESGVKDVTVTLKNASGTVVGTYTTAADGYYWFTNLFPGAAYTLTFTQPTGYSWTTQNVSGVTDNNLITDRADSDVNPADGTIAFTAPASGTNGSGAPDATDNPTLDGGLVQINLQLAKTGGTWTGLLVPGTQVTWTVTPNNAGLSDALAGWSVTDVLPAGLEIVSMSGTGYTCDITTSPAAPVCTAAAALAAGATGEPITVVTKVAVGWTGSSFHNVAYVAPAAGEVVETNVLVVPTTTTDTAGTATDNDAQASIAVVSVGDFVWVDANRDGLQDAGEAPVVGATVTLYAADGTTVVATAATDATGHYWFTGLTPSTAYVIGFDISTATSPAGAAAFFTTPNAGSDTSNNATADVKDSDAVPATPTAQQAMVSFTSQATGANAGGANVADNPGIDAGIVVYNLRLAKALTTAGPFVPGQTVTYTLTPHNDGPAAAVAGWSVSDVLPADLSLVSMTGTGYDCTTTAGTCVAAAALAAGVDGPVITVTAKLSATFAGVATNVAYVSPAGSDGPETNPLVVPTLGTDTVASPTDNDAQASLEVQRVSIGDFVWWDVNRDGLQGDPAVEKPVAGMTVNLYAADGTGAVLKSTTTDANGYYWFTDLLPGTQYTVEFVKSSTSDPAVAAASFTKQNAGADATNSKDTDLTDSDADLTTGRVTFTSPTSGSNVGAAGQADNHGIDAGLVLFNLTLAKTLDTAGPYFPGLTVTYTLTPHNDGPADALAGWSVTDVLPTGLTFVSMTGGATYECAGNVCTSSVPLTATSDGAPVTVTATINAGFIGTANNVAYVSPAGSDVPETNPLGTPVVKDGDTSATPTDNDAQAPLTVVPVSIGDYVWYDRNRDGQQGPFADEPVVADGMVVNLYAADGTTLVQSTTTTGGYYAFTGLAPHTAYVVEFVKPADTVFTTALTGAAATDSNADPSTGRVSVTTPDTGANLGEPGKADDPTIDAGLVELVSIGDYVWYDRNRDGLQGAVADEPVVPGVTVNLLDADGSPAVLPGGAPATTTTDADGFYSFTNLLAGVTYQVQFVKPADTVFTTQNVSGDSSNDPSTDVTDSDADVATGLVTVVAPVTGANSATSPDNPSIDAGLVELVSVGNYVWLDVNRDGLQTAGEAPVAGVTVNLLDADGKPAVLPGGAPVTTVTDSNGYYAFNNLIGGVTYQIQFVTPANMVLTGQDVTGDTSNSTKTDTSDSDADPVSGQVTFVASLTGDNLVDPVKVDNPTLDAGLITLVSVGDYVWFDVNRNGTQDAGEPAVPGVVVNLYDTDGNKVATATTDGDGFYSFTDLLAGAAYSIEFVKPAGSSFTTALANPDTTLDSDADVVTGRVSFTAAADGDNRADTPDDPSIDAGLVKLNLTLTKQLSTTAAVHLGDQITFTLTPHNEGPVDALTGWSVTEVLPAGLTMVSMTGTGYECTATTCVASAALTAGADGPAITVVATVAAVGDLRNVAYITPSPKDVPETTPLGPVPTPGTDTDTTPTDNDAQASLVVPASRLAQTGAELQPLLILGLGLFLTGGLLILITRRRPRRAATQ
jgi:uncharacterized repeat protein (TIGR01451 family)/fimbrial isopeptide formation D2 family protein